MRKTDMQLVPNRARRIFYVLCFICVAFAISTLVLALVLGLQKRSTGDDVCMTKSCVAAANMILENMNTSVDPCDDFNQFACGSFIRNQRIPDDMSKFDVFDVLRNRLAYSMADILAQPVDSADINSTINAKRLYKSCMNETFMDLEVEKKLVEFVNQEFGVWPILNDSDWSESEDDPMKTLIKLRSYAFKPIVDVFVSFNPKDPKSSILRSRQANWFFNKQYYNDTAVMSAYKDFMVKFFQYLAPSRSESELRMDVEAIYQMEKQLADYTLNEDQRRGSVYKNITLRELAVALPAFDWKSYINGFFANIENVTISDDEIVLVDDWSYLENATELYKNFTFNQKKNLKNLLMWVFVKDRTSVLSRRFKEARLDFDKIYRGTTTNQARSLICSNFVLDRMEYAAGRLYVSKYFNEQSRVAATEMIQYIRNEFKNIIIRSEWMDDQSKEKAFAKAEYMDSKIGYPDFLFNETAMHERYKDYQFSDIDCFTNTMKLASVASANDLKILRNERNRTNWISGPAIVNAFYSSNANQICFPAGILQAPFYDSQNPNYLNYGGIGSVIGHEITHGFDDRGRLYDKDGVFFPDDQVGLWTNGTVQRYKEKAACIVNQYSGYTVKQVDMKLNGFQTQGENIADNGGVKEAFYAYQNWVRNNKQEPILPGLQYSQNQLFFINYAQVWCAKFRDQALKQRILTGVHSPGEFRILGPTSNFDEFSKAFNCKLGSRNSPAKKCSVW